jgi:hypothetical protein
VEREKEESGEREVGEWRERRRRVEREKEESGEREVGEWRERRRRVERCEAKNTMQLTDGVTIKQKSIDRSTYSRTNKQ